MSQRYQDGQEVLNKLIASIQRTKKGGPSQESMTLLKKRVSKVIKQPLFQHAASINNSAQEGHKTQEKIKNYDIDDLEVKIEQARTKWMKIKAPSLQDLMQHFLSLNSAQQSIDSLKQIFKGKPSKRCELKMSLNQAKLKLNLSSCLSGKSLRNKGKEQKKKEEKTFFQEKDVPNDIERQRKGREERKTQSAKTSLRFMNNNSKQLGNAPFLNQPIPGTTYVAKFMLEARIFALNSMTVTIPKQSAVCQVYDSVFVAGGVDATNTPISRFDEFMFSGGKMREHLRIPRADASLCSSNLCSSIIVTGGHSKTQSLASVQAYLKDMMFWKKHPPLIQARNSHASCIVEHNTVYVFAGQIEPGNDTSSIQKCKIDSSVWLLMSLSGDLESLPRTNCLSAIEIEKGVMILWGENLYTKSVFSLSPDETQQDTLCVTKFEQLTRVPNMDHSSAFRILDGVLYAHELNTKDTWKFDFPLWEKLQFTEVLPRDIGIK